MQWHKILLIAVFLGQPLLAQKVYVDFDGEADFAGFKTYQWVEGTPVANTLSHQRIVNAVENQLAIAGLEQVEEGGDLNLSYHASASEEMVYDTNYYRTGPAWRWGTGTSTTRARSYVKGTLIVDLWDAKEEKLLWQGVGTDTVSDNPQKNEKKINKIVSKMFQKYPPKKK